MSAAQGHDADITYVIRNNNKHSELGLWPVELAKDLRYALEENDISRIKK